MPITTLDIALHRGAKEDADGGIAADEFWKLGLPFFGGCMFCAASLGCYNMFPTIHGYVACRDCVGDSGFESVPEFEATEED